MRSTGLTNLVMIVAFVIFLLVVAGGLGLTPDLTWIAEWAPGL